MVLLAASWLAVSAWTQLDEQMTAAGRPDPAPVAARTASLDADRSTRGQAPSLSSATFARVGELRLVLPHPDPTLVAFGEAVRSEALALQPVGRLVGNDSDRFVPERDRRGTDYQVLASQGRPRAPTSAADVVVPAGATVAAPVTGTVVTVRDYAMQGGDRDWRVVIQAADRPGLHVVVTHLRNPAPAVGDTVTAGQTTLGLARELSFPRAVDDHLDKRQPHVHLEVTPASDPEPADPNEPAATPDPRFLR